MSIRRERTNQPTRPQQSQARESAAVLSLEFTNFFEKTCSIQNHCSAAFHRRLPCQRTPSSSRGRRTATESGSAGSATVICFFPPATFLSILPQPFHLGVPNFLSKPSCFFSQFQNVWPSSKLEATRLVVPLGCLFTPIKERNGKQFSQF